MDYTLQASEPCNGYPLPDLQRSNSTPSPRNSLGITLMTQCVPWGGVSPSPHWK
ncbi:GM13568 [Drosophila sechellia]|uniref:GM13568 n=1 Tax=Drosophila sechellia TaxID=7238 RepID=B4IQ96_DROSE|nr:GM13568 [Drosophila sechellia]